MQIISKVKSVLRSTKHLIYTQHSTLRIYINALLFSLEHSLITIIFLPFKEPSHMLLSYSLCSPFQGTLEHSKIHLKLPRNGRILQTSSRGDNSGGIFSLARLEKEKELFRGFALTTKSREKHVCSKAMWTWNRKKNTGESHDQHCKRISNLEYFQKRQTYSALPGPK